MILAIYRGKPNILLSGEVQNFTEILVEEEFEALGLIRNHGREYVQDLFCLVLNQLPPHYLRHTIDVRINMTEKDRADISTKISSAIQQAQSILQSNRRQERREA